MPDKRLDYIQSRKKIYVPDYIAKISGNEVLAKLKQETNPIVIVDFDGPRDNKGTPVCQLVTVGLLREKINDRKFPFGHGYVVAAEILGIGQSEYVMTDVME